MLYSAKSARLKIPNFHIAVTVITDVKHFPRHRAAGTQHAREIRVARGAGFGQTRGVLIRK
jgi:hypothetical protein